MQFAPTAAQSTRHASSATPPTIARSCRKSSLFKPSKHVSCQRSTTTRRCRLMIRLTWLSTNSGKPSTWTTEDHQTDSMFAFLLSERRCCWTRCILRDLKLEEAYTLKLALRVSECVTSHLDWPVCDCLAPLPALEGFGHCTDQSSDYLVWLVIMRAWNNTLHPTHISRSIFFYFISFNFSSHIK